MTAWPWFRLPKSDPAEARPGRRVFARRACAVAAIILASVSSVLAEPPVASYIFPAGAQRGTTASFKVGGLYLNDSCAFELEGPGITASKRIARIKTVWFEGPPMARPASNLAESYPQDFAGTVHIAAAAPLGTRYWRVSTSQGTTPLKKFVVGEFPEIVEDEIDGEPIPTAVSLPVTINGRIFPREDVDLWTFAAAAGDVVSCEVSATRIGSPLDAHLEVHGPDGRLIAENASTPGPDAGLRFKAPIDGRYELRICDTEFRGNQDFVYRLTLTRGPVIDGAYPLGGRRNTPVDLHVFGANLSSDILHVTLPNHDSSPFVLHPQIGRDTWGELRLETNDLPEYVEETARPATGGAHLATLPAVLNGRILRPGEADLWQVTARKGQQFLLDLRAGRLGSLLDSVLTILDATGKRLASCDDMSPGETDSRLTWKVPADGTYCIRVEDRLPTRGGPQYTYRLDIESATVVPDFHLKLATDTVNVERGHEARFTVTADRSGGFNGPIALSLDGLPPGVRATVPNIAAGASKAELILKADVKARVETVDIRIRGEAVVAEKKAIRTATLPTDPRDPPIDHVAVAVAVPTPFRFTTSYDQAYTPRGSVQVRHYHLERNGFAGPLQIRVADKQVRYKQGVSGPTVVVPAGADHFDYPLTFAPFMEILRTSRTNLMATGIITDADGSTHPVTFATEHQDEQIVAVVAPGRINLSLDPASVAAEPGKPVIVTIQLNRDKGAAGDVRCEVACPRHIIGVTAAPLTIAAGENAGTLQLNFADNAVGPFNVPLTIRATTTDSRGYPVVAEAPLSVAAPRSR
jgi:hypothetical protein